MAQQTRMMTIVGARPQFVKAAMISHEVERRNSIEEVLVHTGQHYDYGMSQAFFDELSIPTPHINLGIAGGTHAQMTARMLVELERVMQDVAPDIVLLYGDTNSTLAGALVAAKLHIPIAHVEAGARTHSMTNPEEINRVCCDHVSTLLLACTQENLSNLHKEGLGERAALVGDPMYDAFCTYLHMSRPPKIEGAADPRTGGFLKNFYYLTCHREENTKDGNALEEILSAMQELDAPVIYPVHPRNKAAVQTLMDTKKFPNVLACEPIGYLESIWLVSHAKQVITDSGGLQREAFFAGVKCTTVLDFEVWHETMVDNRNLLAQPTRLSIKEAMASPQAIDPAYKPFGDGNAASHILDSIESYTKG